MDVEASIDEGYICNWECLQGNKETIEKRLEIDK